MTQQGDDQSHLFINDQEAEYISRVEELAYELHVEDVMSQSVFTVHPQDTMQNIIETFRKRRISGAPVVENSTLTGIISMEDIIRCLKESDITAPVQKYMTQQVFTVKSSDPVIESLKYFVNSHLGRLIVLDQENNLTGILTKGDITRGLLKALTYDYNREEVRRYRASHLFKDTKSDRTSLILRYNIKAKDFTHGGEASSNIKRALNRLGANPQIARRAGIAAYEAEINLIIHTTAGGYLRVEIEPNRITIETHDDGPGIEDIYKVMQPGYSTASDEIRALGFGAGMGLINISRCVDSMTLESELGKGTHLKLVIFLKEDEMVGEGWLKEREE